MEPNSVKVNGVHFDIEYVTNLHIEGENCEGGMWLSERVIKVDDSLVGDRLHRVLRHEVMHAYFGLSGLTELLPANVEEAICVMSETASYEYLYDGFN